jgi:two-component system NtrC family response regulator
MKRILIVDDEVALVKSMKNFFQFKGVDALTACTGEEALEVLKNEKDIALVITDVIMPGISGIDLLKRIKEMSPAIPVIVMTGMLSIENTVSSLQNGASDYLLKPFSSLDYVWEVVKNYL